MKGSLCRSPTCSRSVEVSSLTFTPFICEMDRLCAACIRYNESKKATIVKKKSSKMKNGAASGGLKDIEKSSSEFYSTSSAIGESRVHPFSCCFPLCN
jgi:hypothetical protein